MNALRQSQREAEEATMKMALRDQPVEAREVTIDGQTFEVVWDGR